MEPKQAAAGAGNVVGIDARLAKARLLQDWRQVEVCVTLE